MGRRTSRFPRGRLPARAASRLRRWSALPVCLGAVGCYSNIPIEPATAPRGEEVVVHFDVATSDRLTLEAGYPVRSLQARVEDAGADSLHVSVWAGQRFRGTVIEDWRRAYAFALSEVVMVERRELNRTRTALLGLGIVAGIIFAVDRALVGSASTGPDPGDPGPPTPSWVP